MHGVYARSVRTGCTHRVVKELVARGLVAYRTEKKWIDAIGKILVNYNSSPILASLHTQVTQEVDLHLSKVYGTLLLELRFF